MSMDIALICTIIGCFVAFATWLSKKDDNSRDDGEWRGRVDAKLDMICSLQKDVNTNTAEVHELKERVVALEQQTEANAHRLDRMEDILNERKN